MKLHKGLLCLLLVAESAAIRADAWSESYLLESKAEYEAAAALFDPVLKREPANEFALLRRAWLNYLSGRYNQSHSDYQLALQVNPQSLDAQIGLTLPLLAQSRWKEAAIAARQALQVAPWNYYAHLRLLVAEEGLQQWRTLLEHTGKLHQRYPSDPTILVYRARAQLWLGDSQAGRETYRQVLQRVPGHLEAQEQLIR